MPKASLKDRAKCASETPLTRARRPTGHSSCDAASIRSFARNRRRSSSGSWLTRPPLRPPTEIYADHSNEATTMAAKKHSGSKQEGESASEKISKRIAELDDWRGEMLARIRA